MRKLKAEHPAIARSATLTINPPGTDTVSITRAEYDSGQHRLRVEATSTRATATLQVFVTSSGQLIGTLSNDGGGRFRDEFSWPVNQQHHCAQQFRRSSDARGDFEIIQRRLTQSSVAPRF
jgi:hypothetical protein